ncbi:hypothetical protein [Nonomuraea sp. NPDC049309]|uniref:hypothetical protein n=1 Tax=Nonomuraea sp. NPDC049309 TaxID=3364350 RepID=UPI00371A2483
MGTESVLCPVCRGVLPASGKDAYTTLRGRLIVSNGYCAGGCVERRAEAAEQEAQRRARQQPVGSQEGGQPQPGVPVGRSEPEPQKQQQATAPMTRQGSSPAVAGAGRVPLRAVR